MSISFNQIPVDLRTPGAYVEIDNTNAVRGLVGMPSKILVIGQRKPEGQPPPIRFYQYGKVAGSEGYGFSKLLVEGFYPEAG